MLFPLIIVLKTTAIGVFKGFIFGDHHLFFVFDLHQLLSIWWEKLHFLLSLTYNFTLLTFLINNWQLRSNCNCSWLAYWSYLKNRQNSRRLRLSVSFPFLLWHILAHLFVFLNTHKLSNLELCWWIRFSLTKHKVIFQSILIPKAVRVYVWRKVVS